MIEQAFSRADEKMGKSIQALKRDLATLRTGRAMPTLLDGIDVEAYGVSTPLNQLATISTPDARTLIVQPWDKSILGDIRKAILKSDLGLNPASDGTALRLVIPDTTEERRRELVKVVRKRVEEAKVAIRNIRRDAVEEVRKMEKDKEISQDESRRALDRLQKLTDGYIETASEVGQSKEVEIMEV
ncbi:MAG: ribosome recycling factor [Chloroflexi bacterium]|nr:ribosome recycling factor [Chloroflexota bacterium]